MRRIVSSLAILVFTGYLMIHFNFTYWENVSLGALMFFELMITVFFVYVDYYLRK